MNPIIDRIASKIKNEIKKLEFIEGIVYYGRFTKNSHDFYSDLDVFIYIIQKTATLQWSFFGSGGGT